MRQKGSDYVRIGDIRDHRQCATTQRKDLNINITNTLEWYVTRRSAPASGAVGESRSTADSVGAGAAGPIKIAQQINLTCAPELF